MVSYKPNFGAVKLEMGNYSKGLGDGSAVESSDPSTHIRWPTAAYDHRSRTSQTLFWPAMALAFEGQPFPSTSILNFIIKKKAKKGTL